MAKLLIKNLTAVPVTLPPPLAGVLTGGGSTVIALPNGGPTPSDIVALLSPYFGGAEVVEFVEVAEGNPPGPITLESSADLIGLSLNNSAGPVGFGGQRLVSVGEPVDASDAATKQYVDTHGGGGGGVTSVAASSPLASSGGTTPTISLASAVPANKGGTGLSASGTDSTKFLQSDGANGWQLGTPPGKAPGGTVGNVQLNDGSGGFTADSTLTMDTGTHTLSLQNLKNTGARYESAPAASPLTVANGDAITAFSTTINAITTGGSDVTLASNPISTSGLSTADAGRVFWMFNASGNNITFPVSGGAFKAEGGSNLTLTPGSILKVALIAVGPSTVVWIQTDKVVAVGPFGP